MGLQERPQIETELKPAYDDAFDADGGVIRFRKNARGIASGFGAGVARVHDILCPDRTGTRAVLPALMSALGQKRTLALAETCLGSWR
jgi:hypothetical protein